MGVRADIAGPVDLLAIHRQDPQTFPFLLESVAGHAHSGRYDLLFAFPGERLVGSDWFKRLSDTFRNEPAQAEEPGLPFCGGWFLLIGYEAAAQIEPRLRLPRSPYALPEAVAVRCHGVLVHDRLLGRTTAYAESGADRLDHLRRAAGAAPAAAKAIRVSDVHEEDPQRFLSGVERIHEYLRAGDVFQVNLSRRWQARLIDGADYADLYAGLRASNPSPFAGLARFDGSVVLSSSPERLVQIENGQVQTRPIAGTRPRRSGPVQDEADRAGLRGNLKERAEHLMLIDLERNDLGRVCEPGSVEVSELMAVESYAHVHHIVSNVRGRLRRNVGPGEVLRAVFPGGTITGCPKVRAMEIIAELEGEGRGPYTGSMGYLSRCGRLDSSILIRSLICEQGHVSFRAGAGIVADSIAEAELEETRAKARGLLLAMGLAP
jgi:anthranilate synthase component 1